MVALLPKYVADCIHDEGSDGDIEDMEGGIYSLFDFIAILSRRKYMQSAFLHQEGFLQELMRVILTYMQMSVYQVRSDARVYIVTVSTGGDMA